MLTNPEFKDLLSLFQKYKVDYLIVGAYAVMLYAEPRFTKDLDILIAVNKKNSQAIFEALKEFGAPLENLNASDFEKEGHFYQMGRNPLRIDILFSIPGVKFEEAWTHRNLHKVGSLTLPFIGKEDLIKAKKASGRPQDLLDLTSLES